MSAAWQSFIVALLFWVPFSAARAESGLATAHPLATRAGETVLARGGNAFDAAVAVAAALAVVEPYASGLGGGGFFLLHRAQDGHQVMLDARERAPAAAVPQRFLDARGEPVPGATTEGARAAAIPGLPAALVHLARHYGRLPLAVTLAPAIALAREGFVVDERYRRMARLRHSTLQRDARARRIFLSAGAVPELGARLAQPELAATLERLARHGHAGFYRGPVAREMVRAVRRAGGLWRATDLARYRVIERAPLVFGYRKLRIVAASPPSSAGVVLAQTLGMLEQFDLDHADAVQRMHWVAEALRRAFRDRALYLGDPDFSALPLSRLLSPAYLRAQAATIAPDRATPSEVWEGVEDGGTTHFSIVDDEGNRVAATLSINLPFGSGFVAGNTGVLLNDEMDDFVLDSKRPNRFGLVGSTANRVAPFKRPLSSMAPTFVEDERGVLILGSAGGPRIISQVLLAILAHGRGGAVDPVALVSAPRFHHQGWPDRLEVEPEGFSRELLDELTLRGHLVWVAERPWGNMQIVWRASDGRVEAALDPRGGAGLAWY